MSKKLFLWICCQLGAREHYAIPRTLYQSGKLTQLMTDAWILPTSILNRLPKPRLEKLRQRFHADLSTANVKSFTKSLVQFEISQKIQQPQYWEHIIARNCWFQRQVVNLLQSQSSSINNSPIIFAYSYAALDIFRYAKSQGWSTVLGQIDAGIVDEQVVMEEHKRRPDYQSNWQPAPSHYWTNWQDECRLADCIIVNSIWSSQALQSVDIPKDKIEIIPLAYEQQQPVDNFTRIYPSAFSYERPLRVLFLGRVALRKGIAALLEAAKILQKQPIEFWLVGPQSLAITEKSNLKVRLFGAVARSEVEKYYQLADVFLFPTISDGFGLTQLEAQSWKLPIIASRFCGKVVEEKVNGLILLEVTGEEIARCLQFCLDFPEQLAQFSEASLNLSDFSLSHLFSYLQKIEEKFL